MSPENMAILVLLGSFFVMVLLRFPIAYAVGLASVFCLLYMGLPLTTICQQMVKGISSFSLMAVPFFITMGCLLGWGGISEKLIALANSLVGWMRGGMAMVNIVASYFFGGISGSAAADTASLGSILIPLMGNRIPDRCYDHLLLRGPARAAEPQYGNLRNDCGRHLRRQPVSGRISAGRAARGHTDDRLLYHFRETPLSEG